MFCRNCGKQLEDGFKVCPYCGEPVSLAESNARRAAQEQTAAEDTQPVHNDIPKEPAPLPAPAPVQPKANKKPEQESESAGGWKVLGFFLGFFGPLLWFLFITIFNWLNNTLDNLLNYSFHTNLLSFLLSITTCQYPIGYSSIFWNISINSILNSHCVNQIHPES